MKHLFGPPGILTALVLSANSETYLFIYLFLIQEDCGKGAL